MTIDEIRKIFQTYKKDLKNKFNIQEVAVFGSYVKGKQSPNSDLDLIVKIDVPISLLDLVKLENHLTTLLGVKVDLIPKEDIREELKERILKEAIYV